MLTICEVDKEATQQAPMTLIIITIRSATPLSLSPPRLHLDVIAPCNPSGAVRVFKFKRRDGLARSLLTYLLACIITTTTGFLLSHLPTPLTAICPPHPLSSTRPRRPSTRILLPKRRSMVRTTHSYFICGIDTRNRPPCRDQGFHGRYAHHSWHGRPPPLALHGSLRT
jgi:hypothetical protein